MNADTSVYLAVQQFVAHEAALLDAGDWRAWLELFDENAVYWMPLDATQTDRLGHASLLCDDGVLRELRCRRWNDRAGDTGALSLQPTPRALRHVSALSLRNDAGSGELLARANVLLAEYARGEIRSHHARVSWKLRPTTPGFLIVEKRVDLLNADGPISDILAYV